MRFCAKEDEYVVLRWFFGRAFANCDGVVVAAAIGFWFRFWGICCGAVSFSLCETKQGNNEAKLWKF